ncbi:MAG: PHP domain-containing protein, partial [Oscillospiraceae bacterium]|nr:PHP domain-containing protein [Oscillospiraceae bacterium]
MGYKQCLHTHSVLCDGKDTLEEMVQAAIEKGFDSIGFSGHSFMDIYAEFSMSEEDVKVYKAEIARL